MQTLLIPDLGFPEIAGYRVEAELGRGGMACVYRARQLRLDRSVALKLLQAGSIGEQAAVARFATEARLIAKLEHPRIVAIYDVGQSKDGGLFYTMPLLPGGDLRQRIGSLSEASAVAVIEAVLEALAHAHAHAVVHRDVKPENVLFDRDERPLLADFGVALTTRTDARVTAEGQTVGSATYMSPEQARGVEVDARSDLYSVGVMTWELLCHQPPFQGEHWLDTLLAHQEQPIPRLPPALAHWQTWMDQALAKSPLARFPDASAIRAALPIGASVQSPTAKASKRSTPVGAMLGMLGLLLGMATTWIWSTSRAPGADDVRKLLADRRWFDPPGSNAWEALGKLEVDLATKTSLQAAFVQGMGADLARAAGKADWPDLVQKYPQWRQAVLSFEKKELDEVKNVELTLDGSMRQAFAASCARYERVSEPALLALLALRPDSAELAALSRAVARLPASRARFEDVPGLPMRVLRPPTPEQAGLAFALQPMSPELASAAGITVSGCVSSSPAAQGCMSLGEAKRSLLWLSQKTAASYRLPVAADLGAPEVVAALQASSAALFAWTGECEWLIETRRTNVAQRSFGAVKRLFGAASRPNTRSYCGGQYVVGLGGQQRQALAGDAKRADVVLWVVRDLAWPK